MAEVLNLAGFAPRSRIYGPGVRFALWVQGCSLHCPGCWNRDTWKFRPRDVWDVEILVARVLSEPGLEGVTLLGGEPMDQAEQLIPFLERVRGAGLSVMTFTGYELDELTTPARQAVLARTDLIVTGRYLEAERDTGLLWRGSRNQQVLPLGPRYAALVLDEANQFEVILDAEGRLEVRGFPPEWLSRL